MIRVFLSASVPLPDKDPFFFETADVIAIRDAVKAAVEAIVPEGYLVFGGHPAITPLVALLLRGMSLAARRRVVLFQSQQFEPDFVEENNEFIDFRLISISSDEAESLRVMRGAMLHSMKFDAAIFIGGMKGVTDEYESFRMLYPSARCYPIASTGAAARQLYQQHAVVRSDLLNELTYPTLFRNLIKEIKGEV
jgi:hypothetical protein